MIWSLLLLFFMTFFFSVGKIVSLRKTSARKCVVKCYKLHKTATKMREQGALYIDPVIHTEKTGSKHLKTMNNHV